MALPGRVRRQVDKKILALEAQPRPPGVRKIAGHQDTYRLRVGNYRVVYRIIDDHWIVLIVLLRNQSTAYRGLLPHSLLRPSSPGRYGDIDPERIMEFAGMWSDMSDEEWAALMQPFRERSRWKMREFRG